jgi:L-alanine-DL-glutamate epimerase-like enolase superfamily enzyme
MQMGEFIESRLGFTAAAHLALTSDQIIFYDFDTPLMMEVDPIIGGITYGENAKIEVSDEPGL